MSHPTQIGRFRIVRPIGAGGMGMVYEALDPEIERRVAIKVLRRELLDHNPELLQRLFVEARAANAIGHQGVVQISEAGRLEDGSGFLVMELLQGQTLTQRIRQEGGRLRAELAVQLALQIASTLRAGHQRGVIHRDLKPDNIMLIADDAVSGGERVKLLDFGIAKLMQDAGSAAPLTLVDMGLGTPGYMAPEQMRDASVASARSDVYGLGAVLFEMLSGRRPHVAPNPADLVVLVLSTDAPPIRDLLPELPDSLNELLLQMLHRAPPEARPDMVEVLRRLYLVSLELVAAQQILTPSGSAMRASIRSGEEPVPPTLLPQGLGRLAEPPGNLRPRVSGPHEVSSPLSSASTPSQMRGQKQSQPSRWGVRVSSAVVAVTVILGVYRFATTPWSSPVPPPRSAGSAPPQNQQPSASGSTRPEHRPPSPVVAVAQPVSPAKPSTAETLVPTKQPAPVASVEPSVVVRHTACEARPPSAISPAEPMVVRAVQNAIRAYHLRLCKGERLVVNINRGDGSLTVTQAPVRLKARDFDSSGFLLRIQGTLAANGFQNYGLGTIVIAF